MYLFNFRQALMQLTIHTDYSLRLLIFLAIVKNGQSDTVHSVAKHYGISVNHLAKVAQNLFKARQTC
jgi:Rrf2 family transcriptional regulator, nitric oxide-sensitive transcriptional repressor